MPRGQARNEKTFACWAAAALAVARSGMRPTSGWGPIGGRLRDLFRFLLGPAVIWAARRVAGSAARPRATRSAIISLHWGTVIAHTDRPFAGGQVGCDWQFAPTWLIGVEGTAAWADIKGSTPDAFVQPLTLLLTTVTTTGTFWAKTDFSRRRDRLDRLGAGRSVPFLALCALLWAPF